MHVTVNPEEVELGKDLSAAKRALLHERLRLSREDPAAADRIRPRAAGAVIPISAEQRRIWLHSETNADLPLYNEAITIHRRGAFNLGALERTLNEILRRHEAWRTSFTIVENDLVQVVHPDLEIRLPLIDLSHLPPQQRETESLRVATEDAVRPIALDHAPLFRAQVIRMAHDDHRLHLTLHHVIFDGVSIYRILMPELAAIYEASASGQASPLAELSLQYGDYSIWRRQHVASAAVLRSLEFWKRELAGPLPMLSLPTDRARPAQISHRGSMECFRLSSRHLHDLRTLSQRYGVTLYMTLLAAFKVLLFRYSGQNDLIVGGATDARRRPELEALMGYFLDTFAIRTYPQAETRFSDYLVEVRNSVLGALSAVDIPFDSVVQAVQPQRNSSHHPIFQVFFSIEPPVAPFAEGWDLTQMDVTVSTSKFDLYLELDERPDHMAARIMYNTDLFDAATIQRMAQHWIVLLEAVALNPERIIGTLPLLSLGELADLEAWNDTSRVLPPVTAYDLIRAQAELTPGARAAADQRDSWTYRQLMERGAVLANRLIAAGVTRGSLVALCLPRSLDLLAGMIAVWQAGAAYLPLDPDAPAGRIELCIADAQPAAILSDESLQTKLPEGFVRVFTNRSAATKSVSSAAPQLLHPEDLAYVIHTSGTTGRPKAVEITHASLVNLLLSMQNAPGFASDVLLAVTTVSFDIAALELFLPLVSGGTVCIASRAVAQDPQLLTAAIDETGCTVMQATPATWHALLVSGWRGPKRPFKILCGGEPLPRELADRLLATGSELWNVYGPTETTIWSTIHHVKRATSPIPIGRPIANTTAYILDQQQQLLPIAVPGKLYLGGAGLARGYRGQPLLTAERFIDSHFGGGARLYDTGDLAVRRADGAIECLGRTDHQVKIRGFRVELEAVEAAVRRHSKVAAVAARVWPHDSGARLCVYLVGDDGPPPDAAMLRRFLQTDQPDYMIPSDVVVLDALPLTVNGKVDRLLLPPPRSSSTRADGDAPTTQIQQKVAALWSEVLGVRIVHNSDNFFDLGGHSLLVAALQQKMYDAFGHRLSVAALFHAPSVQEQAKLLEAAENFSATGLVPLQPRGARPILFWLHPPPMLGRLAAALGQDQPLLGVGLTQADVVELAGQATMQGIAERHVRTILAAQPNGPFYLGGLCTGGIVAYETAAQLRAAGHDVALLILLDSQNPAFYRRVGSLSLELNKLSFYIRQAFKDVGPRKRATLFDRLRYRIRQFRSPSVASTEMVVGEHLTDAAAYRYRPSHYSGDVLLIQPADRPSRIDHRLGWSAVVSGRLITIDVQSHHDELLELRIVDGIAQVITRYLATEESLAEEATLDGRLVC